MNRSQKKKKKEPWRVQDEKKKNGKGGFQWIWKHGERNGKNIVSNIFEKHLLAHCVLWSTTMDQNIRDI